jgi:hypothetical protein
MADILFSVGAQAVATTQAGPPGSFFVGYGNYLHSSYGQMRLSKADGHDGILVPPKWAGTVITSMYHILPQPFFCPNATPATGPNKGSESRSDIRTRHSCSTVLNQSIFPPFREALGWLGR